MDMTANERYLRENGLTNSALNDMDDAPDYNDAFPRLVSLSQFNFSDSSASFPSPFSSSLNGSNIPTTTSNPSARIDEDRRRKLAIHERSASTKVIEILPEDRITDNHRQGGSHSSRSQNANSSSINNGPPLHKICLRIQKETSTTISYFVKDQTLLITVVGRPEQIRLAQARILNELQQSIRKSVNIPLDFHRFIIGPRGATLKLLEQETLTRIAVPPPDSQSNAIIIVGAKDNVKLCEQKILDKYHTQLNKGFERLSIPHIYHPWIRHHLVDELRRQLNVIVDVPPAPKEIDEISIRGEREPVEQAKMAIIQFYKAMEGKILVMPLDIPCEQHRFILGKKGSGLKEIFEKTNTVVRIPNQEDNSSKIQVIGEASKIGEAITMIYKMANALTAIQINAPHWMHSVVKGERGANLDIIKKSYTDVRIFFRDDHIALEGPPEDTELVRAQIQTVIDDLRNTNTTYLEVDIDPQYYKKIIGKNQIRLMEMQEQTGCDIKFPFDESRRVKLMGTKESVEKARQLLLERVQKLANELTTKLSIDPQYYPQIIGAGGKKLEEVRSKFHNIQISFPDTNDKSDKVTLHGDKEDVEKCSKFLQQKIKDLYSTEIEVPKRCYPLLIGKSGSNIQRLREQFPDVRIDVQALDETQEYFHVRLNGKRIDVDKTRKALDEHINQLSASLENIVDQYVTINTKWHSRFFQNKRKLLNDLQQQDGEMTIRFAERTENSDQVLLHGSKSVVEKVHKRIEELIDTWENTTTKEVSVAHRHHGYLLAQGGRYIHPIEKEFNVQIRFPSRKANEDGASKNDNIIRITGRMENIEKATVALEKMIPLETTIDIPNEAHAHLIGKDGSDLQTLIEKYPDVRVTFPPLNSSSNLIYLKGQTEEVEGFKAELLERYEKYEADRKARSFEIRFKIKSECCPILIGKGGRTINNLRQNYGVIIQVSNSHSSTSAAAPTSTGSNDTNDDDHQAITNEKHSTTTEAASHEAQVTIVGYENKVLQCRDAILKLIDNFESMITMEILIDHRVHARIIGSGRRKLQQIMKDYEVEIKLPSANQGDRVLVSGTNQEKIDACIDYLLILEDEFLQDLSLPSQSNVESSEGHPSIRIQLLPQDLSSASNTNRNSNAKQKNRQEKQSVFKVKNAPWTTHEQNGFDNKRERNRNEQMGSPTKAQTALSSNDPNEYPSFTNGLPLATDGNSSHVHETTVNTLPVIWGPPKRNK